MLGKVVTEDERQWDQFLEENVFYYNANRQDTIKCPPFAVMFSREPISAVPIEKNEDEIQDNITTAQAKQKIQFNRRHVRAKVLHVDELVLVFNRKRLNRKGSKMQPA